MWKKGKEGGFMGYEKLSLVGRNHPERAGAVNPDNAIYHNNLSVTLYAMKRYKEALAEAQKAVDLEPDNPLYQ